MTTTTRVVTGPEDLLALTPVLLGFHPEESLVLITVGTAGRGFHARVDLPTNRRTRAEVVKMLLQAVTRNQVQQCCVVTFTADHANAKAVGEALTRGLARHQVPVRLAIRADRGRWHWMDEPEGDGHPYDVSSHQFAVQSVFEGSRAFGSRAELAQSIEGNADRDARDVHQRATAIAARLEVLVARAGSETGQGIAAASQLIAHAEWLRLRIQRALADPAELWEPEDVARALALIQHARFREIALSQLSRQRAAAQLRVWRQLNARACDEFVPDCAGLLGWASWVAGDGALAWCAHDRAIAHQPDHSMSLLLARLLQSAQPPNRWERVRAELANDLGGVVS